MAIMAATIGASSWGFSTPITNDRSIFSVWKGSPWRRPRAE